MCEHQFLFQKTTLQSEAVHQSGSALEFVNEDLREEVLSCAIGRESQIGLYIYIHHKKLYICALTGEFFAKKDLFEIW